jgi:hypothetical protein
MKTTDMLLLGGLGIAALWLFSNMGGISKKAEDVAGTITGTASGIAGIPYSIGQTIGGELGTALGTLVNAWSDIFDFQKQAQVRQNEVVATTFSNAINQPSPLQYPVGSPQRASAESATVSADRAYIQAQLDDAYLRYQRGLLSATEYNIVTQGFLSRSAAKGLTARPTESTKSVVAGGVTISPFLGAANPLANIMQQVAQAQSKVAEQKNIAAQQVAAQNYAAQVVAAAQAQGVPVYAVSTPQPGSANAAGLNIPSHVTGTATTYNPNLPAAIAYAQPGSPAWNAYFGK